MTVYGARPVKRQRRTQAELATVSDAIVAAVETEHPITLRGVFYRVVSMGAVDKSENGYRLIGRELLKLRRAGAIPYDRITDGTRWINKPPSFDSLEQMLEDAAASYRRALWHDQPVEVHLYSEKDAISGVVLPVTHRWDVPLGIVRGYSSESFAWSVARAIIEAAARGKDTYVYQLGDHDPSGIDAWRAFRKSVCGFLMEEHRELFHRIQVEHPEADLGPVRDSTDYTETESVCTFTAGDEVAHAHFARLAVTESQVYELDLPMRPTKQSDSRAHGFEGGSVEVDAIPPTTLRRIVSAAEVAEESEREILQRMPGMLRGGQR
jgi:hypothetical protein